MSPATRATLLALTASVALLAGCVSERVLNVTRSTDQDTIEGAGPAGPPISLLNATDLCGIVIAQCGEAVDGIPGVKVTATSKDGPAQTEITNADGRFCFKGITSTHGEVTVCVDPATLPPGATLVQTSYPQDGPNCQTVPPGALDPVEFRYEACTKQPPCTIPGSISAGFNGTAVVGVGSGPAYIWFNSNFSLKGAKDGSHVTLTNARVIIDGVPHDVPDAVITFAAVGCASTSFNTGLGRWETTVPLAGSDEIFLSGLAFPVTNLPGGAKVTWEGTFGTDIPGICLSWKWGAAAYRSWPLAGSEIDYNAANIKAAHSGACVGNGGDHAGTPENASLKKAVTGGARGGGGSNFTGSWSGTGSLCPPCAK